MSGMILALYADFSTKVTEGQLLPPEDSPRRWPANLCSTYYRRWTSTEGIRPVDRSTEQENWNPALRQFGRAAAIPVTRSLRPGLSSGATLLNVTFRNPRFRFVAWRLPGRLG